MFAAIPFTIKQRYQLLGTLGRQHRFAGIVIHQGSGEGGEQLHMGGGRLIEPISQGMNGRIQIGKPGLQRVSAH